MTRRKRRTSRAPRGLTTDRLGLALPMGSSGSHTLGCFSVYFLFWCPPPPLPHPAPPCSPGLPVSPRGPRGCFLGGALEMSLRTSPPASMPTGPQRVLHPVFTLRSPSTCFCSQKGHLWPWEWPGVRRKERGRREDLETLGLQASDAEDNMINSPWWSAWFWQLKDDLP